MSCKMSQLGLAVVALVCLVAGETTAGQQATEPADNISPPVAVPVPQLGSSPPPSASKNMPGEQPVASPLPDTGQQPTDSGSQAILPPPSLGMPGGPPPGQQLGGPPPPGMPGGPPPGQQLGGPPLGPAPAAMPGQQPGGFSPADIGQQPNGSQAILPPPPGMPGGPPPARPQAGPTITIQVPISTSMSLVHVGSSDSFAITTEGRQAASLLFSALNETDRRKQWDELQKASALYDQIIPRENYGGEYSALQWFADYLLAGPDGQSEFLDDPQVQMFFSTFGSNDFALLKEYLKRKYRLQDIGDEETRTGQDRKVWLEDTILFMNPRRESWEKTSELLKFVKLRPGDKIADVGSGPGYFSFKFAKMVGPEGQVFAIDTVGDHLKYVERAKIMMDVKNVQTVQTGGTTIGLTEQVDAIFLCSLYHNVYAMSTLPEREAFVESIRASLKQDGTLYLVDNGLVEPGVLPYHGPYVAKELIIAQLLNYGFDLIEQDQYIPQRYLLVFKKRKSATTSQMEVH